jgi:hypothetical protein
MGFRVWVLGYPLVPKPSLASRSQVALGNEAKGMKIQWGGPPCPPQSP